MQEQDPFQPLHFPPPPREPFRWSQRLPADLQQALDKLTPEQIEQVAEGFRPDDSGAFSPAFFVYHERAKDGTERGAWRAESDRLYIDLAVRYELADLYARARRRTEKKHRGPSLRDLRAETLKRWGAWRPGAKEGPGECGRHPSRHTVHRWRHALGMTREEIAELILDPTGRGRILRRLTREEIARLFPEKATPLK